MHHLYLVNEGTIAVLGMTVALFVAFGMVIGLGAYVIYCDRLNRAGERGLVHVAEAEPAAGEPPVATSAAPAAEPGQPAPRRRAEPPAKG
ncbi:MAG TPA: hypothetical protein VIP52_15425 [Candidatus Dormibacteraeota bacterium]|jgi:hypothetical protein